MALFPRLFKPGVIAEVSGQKVINLDGKGLRVSFSITRSLTSSPDTAVIKIYGLFQQRADLMREAFNIAGRANAKISAGYEGVPVPVFSGDVRMMRTNERVGPERITTIEADDAGDAISDVTLSGTVGALSSAGMSASTMITVALAAFASAGHVITQNPSVDVAIAATVPAATVALWGAVHIGSVRNLLDEAARTLGTRWWIRDGELFMSKQHFPVDGLTVLLPRTMWLAEPVTDGNGIVRLPVLFDTKIIPGRLVLLQTQTYRVELAQYEADTNGGPWSVNTTLKALAA